MRQLRPAGMPLGVADSLSLARETVALAPGDLLVLYTDGVIDALNEAEEDFGQDRLEALLFGRRHLAAQEVVDALLAAIHAHTGQAPLFDDVTVVVLRRMAP
jgi:sigma-B regulation protein RsbU (phosphoserine phosphatase)